MTLGRFLVFFVIGLVLATVLNLTWLYWILAAAARRSRSSSGSTDSPIGDHHHNGASYKLTRLPSALEASKAANRIRPWKS